MGSDILSWQELGREGRNVREARRYGPVVPLVGGTLVGIMSTALLGLLPVADYVWLATSVLSGLAVAFVMERRWGPVATGWMVGVAGYVALIGALSSSFETFP
jgi:hypothetical protein